jgi:hypothetical protein
VRTIDNDVGAREEPDLGCFRLVPVVIVRELLSTELLVLLLKPLVFKSTDEFFTERLSSEVETVVLVW